MAIFYSDKSDVDMVDMLCKKEIIPRNALFQLLATYFTFLNK